MNLLAEISSLLSLEDRVKMTVTKCFKAREMKRVAEKSFHVVELEFASPLTLELVFKKVLPVTHFKNFLHQVVIIVQKTELNNNFCSHLKIQYI